MMSHSDDNCPAVKGVAYYRQSRRRHRRQATPRKMSNDQTQGIDYKNHKDHNRADSLAKRRRRQQLEDLKNSMKAKTRRVLGFRRKLIRLVSLDVQLMVGDLPCAVSVLAP
ncbi:uncharacterized protein LOC110118710 [Ceratitis capitata]|uniref:uncharacterized protein LOC110118710 n=1 Tax=Ceratitis capitata TaxID=7213 RepID=UPI000A113B93|nr:uncharacterized protein LOC110118710 [Ceratitis capitata]